MLFVRNRTDRSRERRGSHRSPPAVSTTASLGRVTRQGSSSKSSLRDRLKGLAGSITRKGIPRDHNRMPYTPDLWHDVKSNDDLLSLAAAANVQHVETAGQTWPAIRKNISSMASSLRTNRGSGYSTMAPGQNPHKSPSRYPKTGPRSPQRGAGYWTTAATRSHLASGRSSFSTISDVSRRDQEPVPQLPRLSDSSSFLESLSRTGLFRIFTPLPEVNMTGSIRVQNMAAVDDEVPAGRVFPIAATRLPLRLKGGSDAFCHGGARTLGSNRTRVVQRGFSRARALSPPPTTTIDTVNTSSQTDHEWSLRPDDVPSSQREKSKSRISSSSNSFSSKLPVEWLDRVLETSYATRNPISPKLSVSHVTMDSLRRSKTCIFVEFPRDRGLPEPLRCYPGFRAALEDICDRFEDFYAPFAAYNAYTRMITLYSTETARPGHKFIDADTAIFDLRLARSAWIGSNVKRESSADTCPGDTPTGISDGPTEASDDGQSSGDETLATEFEENGDNDDTDEDGLEKPEDLADPAA